MLNLWVDFQSRIYGFDGAFPRTLRDLTVRPGQVMRKYIEGNRVLYYGPVGYFFLMATLWLLIMSLLGIDFYDFTKANNFAQQNTPGFEAFQHKIAGMVDRYSRIFFFVTILFITFWTRIIFRKSGYNFLESAILPFYTSGHFYWVSIVGLVILKVYPPMYLSGMFLALQVLYYGYTCADLFRYNGRVIAFLKGVLVYLLGTLSFSLMVAIVVVIVLLLMPEMRELLRPK